MIQLKLICLNCFLIYSIKLSCFQQMFGCFVLFWEIFFMYFIFLVFTAKASHDSDSDHLSILYGVIAVLCISFVVIGCLIAWLVLLGFFNLPVDLFILICFTIPPVYLHSYLLFDCDFNRLVD